MPQNSIHLGLPPPHLYTLGIKWISKVGEADRMAQYITLKFDSLKTFKCRKTNSRYLR